MRKADDKEIRRFRTSDRFFRADNAWYFTTREGNEGPFSTREQAEYQLRRYLDMQVLVDKAEGKVAKIKTEKRGDPNIWDRTDIL